MHEPLTAEKPVMQLEQLFSEEQVRQFEALHDTQEPLTAEKLERQTRHSMLPLELLKQVWQLVIEHSVVSHRPVELLML